MAACATTRPQNVDLDQIWSLPLARDDWYPAAIEAFRWALEEVAAGIRTETLVVVIMLADSFAGWLRVPPPRNVEELRVQLHPKSPPSLHLARSRELLDLGLTEQFTAGLPFVLREQATAAPIMENAFAFYREWRSLGYDETDGHSRAVYLVAVHDGKDSG